MEADEPTKAPSPAVPTEQPQGFRSWADDNWLNDIKRRDSSAMRVSNVGYGAVVAFIVIMYLGVQ